MTAAQFNAMMDGTFGSGHWRQTGGWRSKQRENALRAAGATTVAPGRTSDHSRGTEDAPGARDVVVNGMSPAQAAALLRKGGYDIGQLYPEGASGGQGAHLHIGRPVASAGTSGSVKVDVNVKHNGAAAHVTTQASGAVQAKGRVEKSLPNVPA